MANECSTGSGQSESLPWFNTDFDEINRQAREAIGPGSSVIFDGEFVIPGWQAASLGIVNYGRLEESPDKKGVYTVSVIGNSLDQHLTHDYVIPVTDRPAPSTARWVFVTDKDEAIIGGNTLWPDTGSASCELHVDTDTEVKNVHFLMSDLLPAGYTRHKALTVLLDAISDTRRTLDTISWNDPSAIEDRMTINTMRFLRCGAIVRAGQAAMFTTVEKVSLLVPESTNFSPIIALLNAGAKRAKAWGEEVRSGENAFVWTGIPPDGFENLDTFTEEL
jgi:hypothetical protein